MRIGRRRVTQIDRQAVLREASEVVPDRQSVDDRDGESGAVAGLDVSVIGGDAIAPPSRAGTAHTAVW